MNGTLKLKTLVLVLAMVWLFLAVIFRPWEKFFTPAQRFETIWLSDFKKLKDSKSLPREFTEIKSVKIDPLAPQLKEYLEKGRTPHFNAHPEGKYHLEIIMDRLENGGVMMQYDLIDGKGNTVWELGRTFNDPIFK